MKDTLCTLKWQDLLSLLKCKEKIAIACSGGLDSRLLALAASQSKAEFRIVHIHGCHIPQEEENVLKTFSATTNIPVTSYAFNPLEYEEVRANNIERCYHCKKAIFSFLQKQVEGFILCDGTNTDDLNVYRPGLKALKELNILSPFVEVGIGKNDIKELAEEMSLPFANQPSQACLLTRFNYGIEPTVHKLEWLDNSETRLKSIVDFPFRLRCVAANTWELHIQTMHNKALERKIHTEFPTLSIHFLDSLHGYFDKKSGLE